jgi:NADP-dependent 3-hydroxy acid dehydrogenase YdfG
MSGKVVVITGASSGIGAAAAAAVARRGHTVVLVARRKDALDRVAAHIGPAATCIAADVTRRAEVRRVIDATLARFRVIDVWINNVGRGITRMPSQLTDEDIDLMMQVNVKSAIYGMQEILPHFRERGTGHVINVSSMLGRTPSALIRSAYNGAKHFLNAITANFRTEVHQSHPGIQFSLVSPGVVRTEFGNNALHGGPDSHSLPDSQSADDIGEVVAQVVESRRPDVYTRVGARQRVLDFYAATGEDPTR